ncbi:SpoIIE family protein phosphatase [uncultured Microscilla sp.]|uniref:SpoIIE family protein phosphatase n=1 Tax=uncultured Microscilla sp. TaxID=432653 RepID=UPI00260621EE|nr:SpoIIE family protein phosphatase [uncultured Microscilla sp.]
MKLHISICVFFFTIYASYFSYAQTLTNASQKPTVTIKNKGIPFIKSYTAEDYGAQNQNWWMAQDKRGVLYVANSKGLLEFDGVRWRLISVPNKSTVRSLRRGIDGVIYVGCKSFVGYVATDSTGHTYLASLMDQIPKDIQFKDVWESTVTDEGVVMQTKEALFVAKDKKIQHIIRPETAFTFYLITLQGKAYVYQRKKGTFRIEKGKLIPEPTFGKMRINFVHPLGNDKYLFSNLAEELRVYDGKTLKPFSPQLEKVLSETGLYYAAPIGKKYLGFGTKNKGVLITDRQGKIIQHIHKGNGLPDNQVYFLHPDQNNNLWVGLSRGIAFIELNSPFTLWNESYQLEGSMQNTFIHQGQLLAGTSVGIYYKPWKSYENPMDEQRFFKLLPETKDHQVWEINKFRGELLAAINPTILRLENTPGGIKTAKLKAFEGSGSVWRITALRENPDLLMAARKSGLYLLEWQNNHWQVKHQVKGFSRDSRRLVQGEQKNTYWISNGIQGVFRVELNNVLDSVVKITHYDKTKGGLPSNSGNQVITLHKKMLCLTENGVYEYNAAQDQFMREQKLNALIGYNKQIWLLKADAKQNIWYACRKVVNDIEDKYAEVGILQKQANGSYKKIVQPLRKLRASVTNDGNGQFNLVDDRNVLITAKEGIIHYDPTQAVKPPVFQVLLREVALTGTKDSVIFGGTFLSPQGEMQAKPAANYVFPTLPYQHNSLRFRVGSTNYTDIEQNEFRYYLEGSDKGWSVWTKETFKEYPNLREGKYTLRIQTRNLYLSASPEVVYSFEIQPPWYRSVWAYIGYVVIGLLLVLTTIHLYTRRLRRQKEKLEETVKERTEEIMLKNAELINQKEEIIVQAENLREANISIVQQKEEISAQAEELRAINNDLVDKSKQIEIAYENIKLLSEIGQNVTSKLSVDQIVEVVYQNVAELMPVSEFGIGLYNPAKQQITYEDYIYQGKKMPKITISAEDRNRFTVLCITGPTEIVVGDVQQEYSKYIDSLDGYGENELLNSFICIPLKVVDDVIGLISIQSAERYAYKPYHLNLLRNLAVYITIALVNTESYNQIQHQKSQIETQNKNINASIRYAQTIQNAILPSDKSFERIFADHFVIYEPKDIVSGDFYWLSQVEDYIFVAGVDCTGHGVPGAFMSMVGSRLLNEIVNEKQIFDPEQIIAEIQQNIWKALRQEESENKDGMDMGLCRIKYLNNDTVEVVYSNAKRPLYYTHQQQLNKIKRDSVMIGGITYKADVAHPVNYKLLLEKGDILYLSSDGFADTPSPKRRSFGEKRLLDTLEEIMPLALGTQKERLMEAKAAFQEDAKQRDDILLLGLKL